MWTGRDAKTKSVSIQGALSIVLDGVDRLIYFFFNLYLTNIIYICVCIDMLFTIKIYVKLHLFSGLPTSPITLVVRERQSLT